MIKVEFLIVDDFYHIKAGLLKLQSFLNCMFQCFPLNITSQFQLK